MKVMVTMPAYNVAKTLVQTYEALPVSLREHILLGNNVSEDDTAKIAEGLGIQVMTHDKNYGYGGNLKRLYREALRQGADVVVEVHPDYQYEPSLADMLVEYVKRGFFDVIQANRIRSRQESLAGGMPAYRYFGNRALTLFENLWFGVTFGEWHSGMRAYHRTVLETLPLESYPDTHAFASDILMDCVMYGFRVAEVPVPVRYESQSSSVNVPGLFAYAGRTVNAALKRPPWKKRRYGEGSLPPPPPRPTNGKKDEGGA
ncbi:MAG: glycosyltransferase family 2 protein [Labilithrix sp.]|nr:glycosyltransferase family 2 protein [Labilithrix sp.]MCW5816953.1 glycosyltransferase family 2 protein [Labilithrix sp.]